MLHDLPSGGHADQQPTPRGKQLLGEQYREGGADGAADDTEMFTVLVEFVEIGVITRPTGRAMAQSGLGERADDIAVRVEQTDLRYCRARQIFLPPRLAQQIFRLEDRRRGKVFPGQDRRWV